VNRRLVSWSDVAARLAPARTYWLATVAVDGSPHVTPLWGVVVDSTWHGYSERRTAKAHHIAADPRVVVHLGDGEDVVIVRGELFDLGRPQDSPAVVRAFDAKYSAAGDRDFLPSADPAFDVLYALRPKSAMMWRLSDYDGTQERWSSSGASPVATTIS
jgi:hypothetical protein